MRRVLRAFRVDETVAFFREIGVALHEEEHGKLFPDANRSRVVLEALLDEAARLGVELRAGERVPAVEAPTAAGFVLHTRAGERAAAQVVLATGGSRCRRPAATARAFAWPRRLATPIVPTTPALVPLVLAGSRHVPLSGVAHEVEIAVRATG